ncbi:hypothetical protein GCM10027447_02510 [Glycomyces halotolerans]
MEPLAELIVFLGTVAFTLFGAVAFWRVLWILFPAMPAARQGAKPVPSRRPLVAAAIVAVIAFVQFSFAAQAAFGSPMGERNSKVIEVLEVERCERTLPGFGVVWSCRLRGFQTTDYVPYRDHPESIVTKAPIEPGDEITQITPPDWARELQLFSHDHYWRSLDDFDKPDLWWLPAAALLLGLGSIAALDRRLRPAASFKIDAR